MNRNHVPAGMSQEEWEAVTSDLNARPSTKNDYRKVLNLLHARNDGKCRIQDFTRQDAQEYFRELDERAASGELSANTVHRYKATLRSIGARMQQHPEIFTAFANPFSGIMGSEIRSSSAYTRQMFAPPALMEQLRSGPASVSAADRLVLMLMCDLGLTPMQIETLKESDISFSKDHPDCLVLSFTDGTFREPSTQPWQQSPCWLEHYPVTHLRTAADGAITWEYRSTFEFFPEFSGRLLEMKGYLGRENTGRPLFETVRGLPYSYRAMHHMVLMAQTDLLKIAAGPVKMPDVCTPHQIALSGSMHAYMLDRYLRTHALYDARLRQASSPAETDQLRRKIAENESVFIPLARKGWIGNWKERFPIPRRKQAEEVEKQLGSDFLRSIVL
jgi:hypothetical protein